VHDAVAQADALVLAAAADSQTSGAEEMLYFQEVVPVPHT
jgi:hypothetical protein